MGSVTRTAGVGLALSLVLSTGMAGAQTTWNVPGDSPTIQGAINLASSGDTVLVAPGTYPENVTFAGKAIALESSGGSAATVIDAGGSGTVITLDPGVAVRGFTLTGGNVPGDGGGILAFAVGGGWTAEVEACRITGNSAGGVGGGAAIIGLLGNAAVTFADCLFDDNEAVLDGGGAYIGATSNVFSGCTFRGNRAGNDGGGLRSNLQLTVQGCRFELNVADNGGGAHFDPFVAQFAVSDSVFIGNRARFGDGGGLFIELSADTLFGSPTLDVLGCRFLENHAAGSGGGARLSAVNFGVFPAQLTLSGALVARNTAGSDGGGMVFGPGGNNRVVSSTVVDNAAGGLGSGLSRVSTVENSIVWGNDLDAPLTVVYSDVQGGAPGVGNISEDPLFVDPAADGYCLKSASLCIDAGNPLLMDPDGSVIDMGFMPRSEYCDAGNDLGSTHGIPRYTGDGALTAGNLITKTLTGGRPLGTAHLVIGVSPLMFPFEGGTMVPSLDFLILGLPLDAGGGTSFGGNWPAGVPADFTFYEQIWVEDPDGFFGYASSNGLISNTD
jgi:hypothetical protein